MSEENNIENENNIEKQLEENKNEEKNDTTDNDLHDNSEELGSIKAGEPINYDKL